MNPSVGIPLWLGNAKRGNRPRNVLHPSDPKVYLPSLMRRLMMATCLVFSIPLVAEDTPTQPDPVRESEPAHTRVVSIEPSNAKDVPAMRITLTTAPMQRTAFGYNSDYAVKVFPFFFFNETGSIRINVEPDALEALGVGEVISFTGEAVNQNSRRRLVEGRAYPADTMSGRIRIVVKVGSIELIFKTTYRFVGEEAAAVDE
jgi:hypothetical protein